MNAILIAVFGVLAIILGFSKPALADSAREANTDSSEYTLSGDSLTGIGTITAEDDFKKFFIYEENPGQEASRFNQSLSLPEVPVILQPAEELPIGNDGLEVQFDLRE